MKLVNILNEVNTGSAFSKIKTHFLVVKKFHSPRVRSFLLNIYSAAEILNFQVITSLP